MDLRTGVEATKPIVVAVLSDTHGHLHPKVKALLEGVDHIIHAGDIGPAQVLADLKAIAPLTAVRGNCDFEAWSQDLPMRAVVELGGARVLVGHVAARLQEWLQRQEGGEPWPAAGQGKSAGTFAAIVTGHSHVAAVDEIGGVLRLNPGSAGPRRFDRPRTIARLVILPAAQDGASTAPLVTAEILTVSGS
jgi:putative phosphoesterase